MLNLKKFFIKKKLKNISTINKNLDFFIPFLKWNMFIQLSTLSKNQFTNIPIFFLKDFLEKKCKKSNLKNLYKYTSEQIYYSSSVYNKFKLYSWKLKSRSFFFNLNFKLKKNFYLNRFLLNEKKTFFSNIFSNYLDFNKQMYIYRFNNFFFFIKIIDNNINFISFFISVFNKLLFFTCLGFKMYNFKKYKKFNNFYLTLNFLTINKFYIFKTLETYNKKFFRFNFYFKFI